MVRGDTNHGLKRGDLLPRIHRKHGKIILCVPLCLFSIAMIRVSTNRYFLLSKALFLGSWRHEPWLKKRGFIATDSQKTRIDYSPRSLWLRKRELSLHKSYCTPNPIEISIITYTDHFSSA